MLLNSNFYLKPILIYKGSYTYGEATSSYTGTVPGAYESGQTAAKSINKQLSGK